MMNHNETIFEVLAKIEKTELEKSQSYLDSKKVHSVKRVPEGEGFFIEAFIEDRKGIVYLPMMEIDHAGIITDLHCQCCDDGNSCIHKLALLVAAEVITKADCDDYHMAQKVLMANTLNNLMPVKGKMEGRYV